MRNRWEYFCGSVRQFIYPLIQEILGRHCPGAIRVENTFVGMETSVAPLSIVKLSEILPLITTGTCSVPCS